MGINLQPVGMPLQEGEHFLPGEPIVPKRFIDSGNQVEVFGQVYGPTQIGTIRRVCHTVDAELVEVAMNERRHVLASHWAVVFPPKLLQHAKTEGLCVETSGISADRKHGACAINIGQTLAK